MKSIFTKLLAVICLATLSVGCEPKPVAEEPEQPAVEVDTMETEPAQEETGVEVQVGGGEGVQVDVNEEAN